MLKTIHLDGKEVQLRATAATPLFYKAQFKRDFFQDLSMMANEKGEVDKKNIDITIFYNLFWVFAKNADRMIKEPIEYFSEFETFPIDVVAPVIKELLENSFQTKKK
ncbi:hypothetical protein [Streptococcus uberis]|uniref:hypothetical protein n=1 Tax=Streptococcus uberis TaxID=1349 RepID=UPI001939AAE9|nr:hypothetical protein [Streptococcus uberis]